MIRYLSVAALLAVGATVAIAQGAGGTAIADRKAAMKAIGGANKSLSDMAKGDVPFDAAKVQAAFKTIEENFAKSKNLYPDGSDKGGETAALPAIWQKKSEFLAKFDKGIADAKSASAASTTEAAFKDQHKAFLSNCGGCHKDYREPPKK